MARRSVYLKDGTTNNTTNTLIKNYTEHIDLVAEAGFKNLFCASGNRNGMDDETGLKNCVEGLKQIIGHAEKKGVTVTMELLNSKIDHKDYMCDRTAWGVELCKRIASPNFKLLYDIYHMQIDEGDVIRTIRITTCTSATTIPQAFRAGMRSMKHRNCIIRRS
jgi:hydroxypyruvate isomerase